MGSLTKISLDGCFTGLFSRSGLISYLSRKGFGAGKRAVLHLYALFVICFQLIPVVCNAVDGAFLRRSVISGGNPLTGAQIVFNPLPGWKGPFVRRLAGGMASFLFLCALYASTIPYFGYSGFLSDNAYREGHARESSLISYNVICRFQPLTGLLHTNKRYDSRDAGLKKAVGCLHLIGLSYRLLVCKRPVRG